MTSAVKEQIKATWTTKELQETVSKVLVNNYMINTKMFEKLTPELRNEWYDMIAESKANHYMSLNVKTPLELVKAMAEFESNVFGSKIIISGDDHKATMEYEECGCWNMMQKSTCFTPEMGEKLGNCFKTMTEHLSKKFSFQHELVMDEKGAKITFIK